jgi:hypothetical protein
MATPTIQRVRPRASARTPARVPATDAVAADNGLCMDMRQPEALSCVRPRQLSTGSQLAIAL